MSRLLAKARALCHTPRPCREIGLFKPLVVSGPRRITAVSRIRGTRRIQEDTRGHDALGNRVQGDTEGTAWIQRDTRSCRFGTVRPRVQIPGPRPDFQFRIVVFRFTASDSNTTVSQPCHRFSGSSGVAAPFNWIAVCRLDSPRAIAEPIYDRAHGPRTVRQPTVPDHPAWACSMVGDFVLIV